MHTLPINIYKKKKIQFNSVFLFKTMNIFLIQCLMNEMRI